MAYVPKELMKKVREELKKQFPKKEGWVFSLRRKHSSSINLDILQAPISFVPMDDIKKYGYQGLNQYNRNIMNGEIFQKLINILNGKFEGSPRQNYDNSDAMTDYFDVGWYINVSQGRYDKPFELYDDGKIFEEKLRFLDTH